MINQGVYIMLTTSKKAVDKQQLADLHHFYDQNNEKKYQEQIVDYYAKLEQKMIHICFSGHFSAGKSTLINNLMKEELLPQSPIPTSANIVEIKQGKEQVIVHFNHQPAIKMETLPSMEKLHQLCRDGDEVKKVEIFKEMAELPDGVTLMDTPGIDAANDADRLMTESALHQVDVLFYVMDYNHVQSEVNARFLKQIDAMNKPYYVIINQMDKHDETEIHFTEFKRSLESVFEQWHIRPKNVFYTSMANSDTGINEFASLQARVHQIVSDNHQITLEETLLNGTNHTVQSSIQEQQKQMNDAIEELDARLKRIDLPTDVNVNAIQSTYDSLKAERDHLEKEYMDMIEQTTKNAQIIPFDIREKARILLESYEPKFKTGLIRNRKKIEGEREKRLNDLYKVLKEKAEISLEWKLRDKVTEFLNPYISFTVSEPIFEQQFQAEHLIKLIEEGATVNGEYILVYTDQVAASIKKMYRQFYKNKWQEIGQSVLTPLDEKLKEHKTYIELYQQYTKIENEISEVKQAFIVYKNQLESICDRESIGNEAEIATIQEKLTERKVDKIVDINAITSNQTKETKEENIEENIEQAATYSYQQTLTDAENANLVMEPINGLDSIRQEITNKIDRLTDRHFTIALFGAFSAGKSSFANALIGEKVLPVSPNPTTAAINKISPVRDGYQHKNVYVILKNEEELVADINDITEKDFHQLDEGYRWIKKTKLAKLDIPDQHKSFLSAFYQGYQEIKDRIGTSYIIGFTEFERYIREETIACFVKEMELFYDCPLTNNHVTLVDTPGADSVNARHTDLAFSYIKDADAILFVTYYNHPFSKPDQQFLERLGRVKDAFELDKMFFMINAIDLAKNEDEKNLVVDYVRNELQRFDIKSPRMFPVSSKQAIDDKSDHTGLPQFEDHFYRFVKEELTQMSMRSVYTDLARANSLVSNWLSMINSDQQEKDRLIKQNKQYQTEMKNVLHARKSEDYLEMVAQKLNKQTFYAKQRFSIQFTDLWKDHIHPGAIQTNGRKGKKELELAIQALFKTIYNRMKHEYEAISIRIEQTWNQSLHEIKKDIERQFIQIDSSFSLSQFEDIRLDPPEVELQAINTDESLLSKWSQFYKDTKTFFAEDGRKQLEEQVSAFLRVKWQEKIDQIEKELLNFYHQQWNHYEQKVFNDYLEEVQSYYRQVIHGIEGQEENKEQLEKINKTLKEMLT